MDAKKQHAFDLYNSGMSYADIAQQLNIAKATAHAWVKEIEQSEQLRSYSSTPNVVRSSNGFDSFGNPQIPSHSPKIAERSRTTGKVRVKEPAYVIEQKARLAELEERTRNLTSQLHASRQKQSEQLHRRCDKIRQIMKSNDGEVWSLDELDDCREQLESIREDLIDLDESEIHWIIDHLDPLIELLQEAVNTLEEDGLEDGEVYFFED